MVRLDEYFVLAFDLPVKYLREAWLFTYFKSRPTTSILSSFYVLAFDFFSIFEFRTTKGHFLIYVWISDYQRTFAFNFRFSTSLCRFFPYVWIPDFQFFVIYVRIPDYQSAFGIPECANSGLPISVWYTGMCEFRTTKQKNIFRPVFFAPLLLSF